MTQSVYSCSWQGVGFSWSKCLWVKFMMTRNPQYRTFRSICLLYEANQFFTISVKSLTLAVPYTLTWTLSSSTSKRSYHDARYTSVLITVRP